MRCRGFATWPLILVSMAKASAQCWCANARIGRKPVVTEQFGCSSTDTRSACANGIPRWAIILLWRTALQRCRYQARARWKARCRCWDGRSLWRGNLFESIFLCILCAFDGDHSETLRSFKFVHSNVWSTTEGIVSTILDSLSCRGFWLAVKLYRHTGTLSLFDPSLCDCMDSLRSDGQKELCVACFPVNMRTWSIET